MPPVIVLYLHDEFVKGDELDLISFIWRCRVIGSQASNHIKLVWLAVAVRNQIVCKLDLVVVSRCCDTDLAQNRIMSFLHTL